MKQPKRLTRSQKECVSAHYMNPKEWMCYDVTDFYLKVIHKRTGVKKTLDKFRRRAL